MKMRIRSLYLFTVGGFAVVLFLYGFFPIKTYDGLVATENDYPSTIGGVEVNISNSYEGTVGRLVIMVIDALRQDFVYGAESAINMPYTTSIIRHQMACCVTGKADPPTVTMPRIKAMITGTVPNFADVVLNFGSSQITEDNLLVQAKNYNSKILFYGDDTWLKLFPNTFSRSEGTTSFFVTDFTEVDNNVTRHLERELNATDWRIMILHYLGLDHIGHLEGPKSLLVRPKLQEMDTIVQSIHSKLLELDKASEKPSVLVLCGDHGMKDTGSHGGATLAEVLVPIVIIGPICYGNSSGGTSDDVVSQIDVASTLSVLLGLPIPIGNLGKIIPQVLHKLPVVKQLYALHYNAKQVVKQYDANFAQDRQNKYLKYQFEEAVRLHAQWLRLRKIHNSEPDDRISALYSSVMKEMGAELAESMVHFDVYLMTASIVILWQNCAILLLRSVYTKEEIVLKESLTIFLTVFLLVTSNYTYCSMYQCNSILCGYAFYEIFITLLTMVIVAINLSVILNVCKPRVTLNFESQDRTTALLVGGTALQLISLASSSFIEEEHQVWYFLWITLTVCLLFDVFSLGLVKLKWQWLLIVFGHRVLRQWNQTGDKWATLPDIGDWLIQPANQLYYSGALCLGLIGVFLSCDFINDKCVQVGQIGKLINRLLWGIAVLHIYLYRCATGSVTAPFQYTQSRGFVEVHTFWWILATIVILGTAAPIYNGYILTRKTHSLQMLNNLMCSLATCWILLCALLHRPHDAVLVPSQVFATVCVHKAITMIEQNSGPMIFATAHVWLGMVFYFYQGNANSLANLDIASGYAGQEEYNTAKVALLLLCNTYSAVILSQLLLVTMIIRRLLPSGFQKFSKVLGESNRMTICLRLFSITIYATLITFQRYHLFIWTVFSPKLLYESMHTGVILFMLLSINLLVNIFGTTGDKKLH